MRIARAHVLVSDDGRDAGWFVGLVERIEGPHDPAFISTDRAQEFGAAGLRIDGAERVSSFGNHWLCTPTA